MSGTSLIFSDCIDKELFDAALNGLREVFDTLDYGKFIEVGNLNVSKYSDKEIKFLSTLILPTIQDVYFYNNKELFVMNRCSIQKCDKNHSIPKTTIDLDYLKVDRKAFEYLVDKLSEAYALLDDYYDAVDSVFDGNSEYNYKAENEAKRNQEIDLKEVENIVSYYTKLAHQDDENTKQRLTKNIIEHQKKHHSDNLNDLSNFELRFWESSVDSCWVLYDEKAETSVFF